MNGNRGGINRRAWAAAAAALAASACFIEAGDLAGKECTTNVDCLAPYVCIQRPPNSRPSRSCELLRGVETAAPGGGGTYDYCHDVKPLLDKSCVANCHGTDTSGSSQVSFRLDAYGFDSGFPLGAFAKASRIRARVQTDDMPPASFSPRLSADERAIVTRWVDLGAPDCLGSADGG